jgi:signal transduction histidine kinase/FixJ family two-component response regulator
VPDDALGHPPEDPAEVDGVPPLVRLAADVPTVDVEAIYGEHAHAIGNARPGFIVTEGGRVVGAVGHERLLAAVSRIGGDLFRHRTFGTLLDVLGRSTSATIAPSATIGEAVGVALDREPAHRLDPLLVTSEPPRLLDMGPLLLEHARLAALAAAEADRQRDAANEAGRARTAFLATMSHELRTPLNAILGFVSMLDDEELDASERRRFHGIIQRNGQHLLTLVSDILDLTRLESGQVDLERITMSPSDVVLETVESLQHRARDSRTTLDLLVDRDGPRMILGEPTRLRQVIFNLVGNAIKFSPQATVTVQIGVDASFGHDGGWFIECRDTGIGIAADRLPRIFEPFVQAEAGTTRRFGGTGLGLSIVRRIVDAMDGSIEVWSEPGRGTTFRVRLPLELARATTTTTPTPTTPITSVPGPSIASTPAASAGPCRILVIEDGPDNIRLFKTVLEKAGHTVSVAEDGAAGLASARRASAEATPFDCILMDRHMPKMDGCEATRRLRAGGDRTPIIAVTASASAEDEADFRAAGCTRFLAKPVAPTRLRTTVNEVIAEARTIAHDDDAPGVVDRRAA